LFVILNRNPLAWVFKGYAIYLAYLFIGFSFYIFATAALLSGKNIRFNSMDKFVLAYSFFLLLRAVATQQVYRSAVGLALYAGTIPIYWIFRFVNVPSSRLTKIAFLAFIYLVIFALLEIVLGVPLGPVHWYYSRLPLFPHRLSSTLGSSNHFSIILPTLAILLTSYLLNRPKRRIAHIILLNLVTLFFTLGTSSRGGLLVYLASLVLLLFFQGACIKKKASLHYFSVILVILILFFGVFCSLQAKQGQLSSYIKSIFNIGEGDNQIRVQKYRLIYDFVSADPRTSLVGIGMGYTGNIVHLAGLPTFFQLQGLERFYTTESSALKLLLETGTIGLLFFYFLLFRTIRLCHLYAPKFIDSYDKGMFLGISCILTLFILRSLILQVFDIPGVLFLTWAGMGCLSNTISRCRSTNRLGEKVSSTK